MLFIESELHPLVYLKFFIQSLKKNVGFTALEITASWNAICSSVGVWRPPQVSFSPIGEINTYQIRLAKIVYSNTAISIQSNMHFVRDGSALCW